MGHPAVNSSAGIRGQIAYESVLWEALPFPADLWAHSPRHAAARRCSAFIKLAKPNSTASRCVFLYKPL